MSQTKLPSQSSETSNSLTASKSPSSQIENGSAQTAWLYQLLNALTSGVSALTAAININYQYVYFSQAYGEEVKRILGINLQTGMTVMDVYIGIPDRLAFALKQWNRALGGEVFKEVVKFPRVDSGESFYEATYSPINNDKGVVTGAVVVAKNISLRIDAEHSLSESEMRYQQLFDRTYNGLAICEFLNDFNGQPMDYRILDVNPNFTKVLGITREQIIGSTYSSLKPVLDLLSVNRLSQVAKTGKAIHFEEFSPVSHRNFEVVVYSLPKNCFAIMLTDVTERKSEKENVNWLASFPEQNPMAVLEVDYEGTITYQNPAAIKFFSHESENPQSEFSRFDISDIIDKLKTGEDLRASKDILIGDTWLQFNFYHMPQRKRVRMYAVDVSDRVIAEKELLDLNRKLEATVNQRTEELYRLNQELNIDILQRKNTEDALKVERKRFNDVLEVLPVYVILLTPAGHINFANKYFSDTFNYSTNFQCTEISQIRQNSDEINETFKPLVSGLANVWEWVSPENRVYTVHEYPFTDVDGSPLVLEMGLDITEIRRAQEKLLETSNYNRSLIEANLDFLVTINQDGIIGDVNTAAEIATGLSREQLIGSRFATHFENAEAANRSIQQVLETGSVRNYELSIKHQDGHTIPVAYNASFYTDLKGKIVGIFAGARELTELRRKENQLLELNHALEEAIEHEAAIHDQLVQAEKFTAMGRLLASVTHEINNPLQTISNCLYLISSDIPDESQASQFLEMAKSETKRISKLVAELKDVYRPRQENTFAPIHMPTFLDEIYNLIKLQLLEKHIDWQLVYDCEETTKVWVDGMNDQLKQVFLNLSMNAMEAMQPEGGLLEVTLTRAENNEIGILFRDTGPGISPENISKIFEPFFSTKNQGLGLGLAICYDIIQRHRGHLEVSSIIGKGSTFEVWLPGNESQSHSMR